MLGFVNPSQQELQQGLVVLLVYLFGCFGQLIKIEISDCTEKAGTGIVARIQLKATTSRGSKLHAIAAHAPRSPLNKDTRASDLNHCLMLANKLHGPLRFAALSPESELALPIQRHNWGRFRWPCASASPPQAFFVLHVLAGLFVLFLSLVRNLQAGNAGRVSHSWKRLDPARFRFAGKAIRCSGESTTGPVQ